MFTALANRLEEHIACANVRFCLAGLTRKTGVDTVFHQHMSARLRTKSLIVSVDDGIVILSLMKQARTKVRAPAQCEATEEIAQPTYVQSQCYEQ